MLKVTPDLTKMLTKHDSRSPQQLKIIFKLNNDNVFISLAIARHLK